MSWQSPPPRPSRKKPKRKPWKSRTKPRPPGWREPGSY